MLKLWRRASRYVRYDLREIVVPSSLPNPPSEKEPPPRTWKECWQLVKIGSSEYADTWRYRSKEAEAEEESDPAWSAEKKKLKDDFAFVARGGAEHIKPYLQRLYAMRIATLQAAGQEFVGGYREGLEKAKADAVIDNLAESFWDESKTCSNGSLSNATPAAAKPVSSHDDTPIRSPQDRGPRNSGAMSKTV